MSMDLKFRDPKVLMRTNLDYSGPILSHGKKAYDELLRQQYVQVVHTILLLMHETDRI